MALGRKNVADTDLALTRAQKIVASTIEVGTKTAETMEGQTKQMERVLDDLEEIRFTMKKATQVIRDMTRGMATDRHASDARPLLAISNILDISNGNSWHAIWYCQFQS